MTIAVLTRVFIIGVILMDYENMTEKQLLDLLNEYKGWKPSECSAICQELERRRKDAKKNCSTRATKFY